MNINSIHSLTLALLTLTVSLSPAQLAHAQVWVTNAPMNFAREGHTATLLPNGKVLVAGGGDHAITWYLVCPTNTEIYDPASGTWATNGVGALNTPREQHTATLLPNGKVLVVGGEYFQYGSGWSDVSSAELFDPASLTWTLTGSLNTTLRSHTATLLPNGKVLVAAGWNGPDNNPTNGAEIYDPASGTWSATGTLNVARYCHTATLLANGKVLVAGGTGDFDTGYSPLSSAELYDPASGTWTTTGSLNTERQYHTATLLPSGKILVVGGMDNNGDILASAELYNPTNGTWTATGSLNTERQQHTATLLPNGQVLVTGGVDSSGYPSGNAELYDPVSGAWTPTYSLPNIGLVSHTATLLANGKLLIAGGASGVSEDQPGTWLYDWPNGSWTTSGALNAARAEYTTTLLPSGKVLAAGGGANGQLSSAELYGPTNGTWTTTGPLNTARQWHTATLLPSGEVLVAGGWNGSSNLSSAELYSPTNGTWTTTGSLNTARHLHSATLLANGMVLVTGGATTGGLLSSAELYNPASGTWTATGPLNTARGNHTATLLPNGEVLVAGGVNSSEYLSNAELYNPASETWTATGSLNTARGNHTATLLPHGKVLVAGGYNGGYLTSVELYDPATGIWVATGSLHTVRGLHTATLLANGKVLVAGGYNGSYLAGAELYDVGLGFSNTWQPQIATCTSPLAANGCLTLTGSRFRGVSEGSAGNGSQDSPTDHPVVQLRRLDNEQTVFLLSTNWQTNSFTSAPVSGLPAGWTMATMLVNGIPSPSSLLLIGAAGAAPGPIVLTNTVKLSGGACRFSFTNTPGLGFTALAATNLALPLSNWMVLGSVTEVLPGQFQFTDLQATNTPLRFYRVRSP